MTRSREDQKRSQKQRCYPGSAAGRRQRRLITARRVLSSGLTTLILGLLPGCSVHPDTKTSAGPRPAAKPPALLGAATMTGKQVTLREGRAPHLVWELHSPQVELTPGSKTGRLLNINGTFYQEGKPGIQVKAPLAVIDYASHTVVLAKGGSAFSPAQSESFSADRIVWHWLQPNGLEATGHVQLQRGAASVNAGRLIADPGLRRARLLDHPEAVAPESGV